MKCRQKHKELSLKIQTKQILIIFLSVFIGSNCTAKKNLEGNHTELLNDIHNRNKNNIYSLQSTPSESENFNIDGTDNKAIQNLSSRVQYLEELLNSYQAQSLALENPTSFFNKKILLTNGSMLYGNITFQDDAIVQLETLIGTLAIEKNTIIRVVDQAVSVLREEDKLIELNTQNNIETKIEGMQNKHSAEVVLLGDFTEQKDENQNTILTGQVKNLGLKRADFAKITFTIYRNKSYDSMPVEYTAFINGSSVSFEINAMSTSSLYSQEVGNFSLVIPSDFGPFVSYTYRIDWEEYE